VLPHSERTLTEEEIGCVSMEVAWAAVRLYIAWHADVIGAEAAMRGLGRVIESIQAYGADLVSTREQMIGQAEAADSLERSPGVQPFRSV
jgi:hypothetical protein